MIKKILFITILLVAVFFRFFLLSTVPPSPSVDEVTIGWNAYSILQTGHDEYGYHLPLLLRAYDDYHPGLYTYLVIPFVKLLGLTVLAVRLPAAILSVITVGMTFFLIRSMLFSYKRKNGLAFLTMMLLAISPWHIYISRLGLEVNVGLALVIAATLLFFLFIEHKKGALLVGSLFFFAFSFYGYQSEKLSTPLFVAMLFAVYFKNLLKYKKVLLLGLILAAAVTLPVFLASVSPNALLRLKGTSIFIDNPAYTQSAKAALAAKEQHNVVGEVLANRRITTARIFLTNYILSFNPKWYIQNSGNEPFKAPNEGLMYSWEFAFLVLGIILFLLSRNVSLQLKIVSIFWVLISFVASGISTGAPHALRSITVLPLPQLFAAFGIVIAVSFFVKHIGKTISIGMLFLLSIIALQSVGKFSYDYFSLFPLTQSQSFQYAIGNAMKYVSEHQNKYQRVVVSNRKNLYQSYMFYLFYTKYDPKQYVLEGGTKSGGFAQQHSIGNIVFRPINWQKEVSTHTLYVGNPTNFPKNIGNLFVSYYLDGTEGIRMVSK